LVRPALQQAADHSQIVTAQPPLKIAPNRRRIRQLFIGRTLQQPFAFRRPILLQVSVELLQPVAEVRLHQHKHTIYNRVGVLI
jgi:hypothetical protein